MPKEKATITVSLEIPKRIHKILKANAAIREVKLPEVYIEALLTSAIISDALKKK
jgi:hypothetical protein